MDPVIHDEVKQNSHQSISSSFVCVCFEVKCSHFDINSSNVKPVIYPGSAEAQDNIIVGSQQNRQPIKSFLDTKPSVCFALSGSQSEAIAMVRREKKFWTRPGAPRPKTQNLLRWSNGKRKKKQWKKLLASVAGDTIDLFAKVKFCRHLASADFSPWWRVYAGHF